MKAAFVASKPSNKSALYPVFDKVQRDFNPPPHPRNPHPPRLPPFTAQARLSLIDNVTPPPGSAMKSGSENTGDQILHAFLLLPARRFFTDGVKLCSTNCLDVMFTE